MPTRRSPLQLMSCILTCWTLTLLWTTGSVDSLVLPCLPGGVLSCNVCVERFDEMTVIRRQLDLYEMTPLHILALSTVPNLSCSLYEHPS
eukprot:scaffold1349_cov49-Cylindrotheca_fusiformis.AAC.1